MKVPHSVVGRTRPSAQPLGYLSAAGATPAAFGAGIGQGLQQFGGALAAEEARERALLEQREEQTTRYETLTNFGEFETRVANALQEGKRTAQPSGKGFTKQMEELYAREEAQFLSQSVPQELQGEFRFRSSQVKQKLIGDALAFQYAAGDKYFEQGVADAVNKAKVNLDPTTGGDPANLEAEKARVFENIDATGLPQVVKEQLKRDTAMGLEAVAYKTEAHRIKAAQPTSRAITDRAAHASRFYQSRGFTPEQAAGIVGNLIAESGLDTDIPGDAGTSFGIAQWRGERLTKLKRFANANGRDWTDFDTQLEFVLVELEGDEQTAGAKLRSAKTVDEATAAMIGYERPRGWTPENPRGGHNFAGRLKHAEDVAGGAVISGRINDDLDSDPRFQNVPFEDRLALRADAEREVEAARAADAAARKQLNDSVINALQNNIVYGTAGQADIDTAVELGVLSDFNDRKRTQDLLDERTKDIRLLGDAQTKLASEGAVWDPTDEKDQQYQNAIVGKEGLAKIANMDQGYVNSVIIPNASRTGDIATDTIGALSGMVRSNDQKRALFALDSLRQLQEADPRAFDHRVPDRLARDVEMYSALRNSLSADELMERINGGADQKTRQANELLIKEAEDYLNGSKNNITTLQTRIGEVVEAFDTITTSPNVSGYPAAAKALDLEYRALFIDNYVRHAGNADTAHAATVKEMQKNWGVSELGGRDTLMRNPPEKSGYRQMAGSWDWLDAAARREFDIPEGATFELLSDDQTKDELDRFKAGQGHAPSYQMIWYDADGVPRVARTRDGKTRAYFEPSPADKLSEIADFERKKLTYEYGEFRKRYRDVQFEALQRGEPVPQEYIDEDTEFRRRLNMLVSVQQGTRPMLPEERTIPDVTDDQIIAVP